MNHHLDRQVQVQLISQCAQASFRCTHLLWDSYELGECLALLSLYETSLHTLLQWSMDHAFQALIEPTFYLLQNLHSYGRHR